MRSRTHSKQTSRRCRSSQTRFCRFNLSCTDTSTVHSFRRSSSYRYRRWDRFSPGVQPLVQLKYRESCWRCVSWNLRGDGRQSWCLNTGAVETLDTPSDTHGLFQTRAVPLHVSLHLLWVRLSLTHTHSHCVPKWVWCSGLFIDLFYNKMGFLRIPAAFVFLFCLTFIVTLPVLLLFTRLIHSLISCQIKHVEPFLPWKS